MNINKTAEKLHISCNSKLVNNYVYPGNKMFVRDVLFVGIKLSVCLSVCIL